MHSYYVIYQDMAYNVNTIVVTRLVNSRIIFIDQLNIMDLQTCEFSLKQTICDTLMGTYESTSKHFLRLTIRILTMMSSLLSRENVNTITRFWNFQLHILFHSSFKFQNYYCFFFNEAQDQAC